MGVRICLNSKSNQSADEYTLHLNFQQIEIISNLVNCVCTSMQVCVRVRVRVHACVVSLRAYAYVNTGHMHAGAGGEVLHDLRI